MNVKRRSEPTRTELIRVARELFSTRGYTDTSTEEIVRQAQVTRGALYYHFKDKDDLFAAVFEQIEGELTQRVADKALREPDAFEQLRVGARVFLDGCLDPAVRRIVLIEGPGVLGFERWREIEERHGLGLMQMGLQAAMDAGAIDAGPADILARVVLGALTWAALVMADAPDQRRARREVGKVIERLLEGLRPSSRD